MTPHLSNLQFYLAVGALAFVFLLTLAALVDIRRKRKAPPFLNYFHADFDRDQWEHDSLHAPSFNRLVELRAYNRTQAQTYEDRHSALHTAHWE